VILLRPDDPTFTIVAATDAFLKAAGKARPNLTGRGYLEILTEDGNPNEFATAEKLRISFRKVIATKLHDTISVIQQEYRSEPFGVGVCEERHLQLVSHPILQEDGSVAFLSHQIEDVTERTRAEKRQRENEDRQAYLLRLAEAIRTLRDPEAIKAVAARLLGERLGTNRAFYAEVER